MRLSGLADAEGYRFQEPAPGLIQSDGDSLFVPRLSLFLDAQAGSKIYVFAQARADRGFDPGDEGSRERLDEYAVRFTPADNGAFNIQAGMFATFVGNWTPRHDSWSDPFITAPLPYENATGVWDIEPAPSARTLMLWGGVGPRPEPGFPDKDRSVPIIWGPDYTTGAAVFGQIGGVQYAAEVKNAALSSRPEAWDADAVDARYPTVSARLGYLPNPMWTIGFSASAGVYLRSSAAPLLAPGYGLGDYREVLFGQDAAFAWHRLQLWAESFEARFEIPTVGAPATYAYYLEAKYKFTPQLFGALRWNQQLFSSVPVAGAGPARWGANVWRIDAGPTYRFTPHTQFKIQYSVQRQDSSLRGASELLAGQFTVRF